MITFLVVAFLAVMAVEALGTAVFLGLYLRSSDWRSSAVGRHLAYYAAALLGLYVSSICSFFIHDTWIVVTVLVLHAVFAVVIWQRVVLVWRAQHQEPAVRSG